MSTNESSSQGQGQWQPAGIDVLQPNSEGFGAATTRWNAYGAPVFAKATVPGSAAEVAEIVKAARASEIPFLAMGGRHGYGHTFSQLQGGLAIDLRHLNSVAIDKTQETVTIGGGAKIRDVINPVADAGFQIASGACNGAGYVGTTLGAGIGFLQGTFGLALDALFKPGFVLGYSGAGANFGIVTSATYKLSKQINGGQVFYAELVYSAEQQSAYFEMMEAYQDQRPAQLGCSSCIFWNPATNSTCVLSTFIYVGTEEAARSELQPFFDLNPVIAAAEDIPFQRVPNVILTGFAEVTCNTTEGIHSIHTVNVRKFTAATFSSVFTQFDAFLKQYEDARSANSAIVIDNFGTAGPTSISDDSTAYPWRDAACNVMLQMRWTGLDNPLGETANTLAKKLRDELAAKSGYDGLSAYVNYAWGDETLEQIYRKDKLERLVALKKQWDPANVFGYSNGIPPNYKTQ
ncbi:hypothetical protein PFICI_13459 [Pestalotiopsis fici W106-1]|uniref:FAD-binding PCMH-type domain-containing protein n=1 Tax=Pestalotiopsis fici (strain W106-1 / CGMCC3.15140) TaxID=1229662 RepID=W3WM25_PESFW|nr:uncharacterized protein PFICI_13459 [Pestalotiopsis fici W106-1]ETS74975.1 hypothetical protein PFICI_13459 [Pestalotiopsis fici W106-1]